MQLSRMLLTLASSIETGPGQVPHGGHARHTVRHTAGRRDGAAHGLDFHEAKGRPFSSRAIFSRSNSLSRQTLATTDLSRFFSSSSTSASRLLRPLSPAARKRSRQSLNVATVTRCLRDVVSRSAPRRSSRTTETLRVQDHRPPPRFAVDSGDCSVALRAPSAAPESLFSSFRTFLQHNVSKEVSIK